MAKLLTLLFLIVAVSTGCSRNNSNEQTVSTNAGRAAPIRQLEAAFSKYHLQNYHQDGKFEPVYSMKILEKHPGKVLVDVHVHYKSLQGQKGVYWANPLQEWWEFKGGNWQLSETKTIGSHAIWGD